MEEEEEDSTVTLLQKQKKELKKVKAARQRTHARFETLLNVGSGSEEISAQSTPIPKRSKKKERTKTADAVQINSRKSPTLNKRQSRSHENLLQHDDSHVSSSLKEKAKSRSKIKKASGKENRNLSSKNSYNKSTSPQGETVLSAENDGFEHSLNDVADDASISQQIPHDENTEQSEQKLKKKPKKKKKRKVSSSERILKALEQKYKDENLLLCIHLHRCDQLKPDARIHHPVVRIHLVDMATGQYVKKRDKTRNVTSIVESENEAVDYIMPVISQPYDFRKQRCLIPTWEETILYNEMYSYFLQREQDDPSVILFFEVLDFMEMNLKSKEYSKTDKGWHRIAWAFLKLVSPTTNVTNTDKRVRLQLYQPLSKVRVQPQDNSAIEIFQWWMYGTRQKYNSTLYVTVKGVTPPKHLRPTMRSTFPTQQERGGMTFDELSTTIEANANPSDHETSQHFWTKLPGQLNRIPNKFEMALPVGRKGCSVVRFSEDGRYIACACSTNEGYPIMVYEFPEAKLICSFGNHFGIVYDLVWSQSGKELLSASADTTVRCWDTKRFTSSAIKLFPHPSYVYTCKYHTYQQNIVVTGSYDRTIRVWNKMSSGNTADLLKEFTHHPGFVNTIVFTGDGLRMFSGDSEGVLIEWNTHIRVEKKKKIDVSAQLNNWSLTKKLELEELKRISINTLRLHPGEKKLLIHTRDSLIRMLDLRSYGVLKVYVGGLNFKDHMHLAMSPCGSFVFCGTENGLVHVWNTESGDPVYTYKELGYVRAVSDVDFHPHDNYVAFCCYGDGQPVYVYSYDPKVRLEIQQPLQTQRATTPVSEKVLESQRNLDDTVELYKNLRTAATISSDAKRMERVQEKLLSVTTPRSTSALAARSSLFEEDLNSTKNRVTFKGLSPRDDTPPRFDTPHLPTQQSMLSTWGSDFSLPSPTIPSSPHAQQYLGSSRRLLSQRELTSSPVQGYPSSKSINMQIPDSPLRYSQLQAPTPPKPVFNFEDGARHSPEPRKKVIALYNYEPNRADELHLQANDVITVVDEDDENWWMGQMSDGRQGYFPVNYVTTEDASSVNKNKSTRQSKQKTVRTKSSPKEKKVVHSAVVDDRGNLRIVSGTEEESDSAIAYTDVRRKRNKRQQQRREMRRDQDDEESIC